MNKAIEAPRSELSQYAPRIISFKIKVDKIREVIGPGGKVINEIIDSTGVSIDIENDGNVTVCSAIPASLDKAVAWIKSLVQEAEVGQIYEGKVVRIMNFGAFVEILPHKDGMVHISELAPYRVKEVTDIVKIGDTVKVKVIEIDEQGRINLSMKSSEPEEGHGERPPQGPPGQPTPAPQGQSFSKKRREPHPLALQFERERREREGSFRRANPRRSTFRKNTY